MPEIWKVIITILSVSCGIPTVFGCVAYSAIMFSEYKLLKGLALIGASVAVALTCAMGLSYLWK